MGDAIKAVPIWLKLALALIFTVGAWAVGAVHWADLLTPNGLGGLLMQFAIVTAAALGINLPNSKTPPSA